MFLHSGLSSRLSRHFGQVKEKEIKEIKLGLEDLPCQPNMRVKVYYYREQRIHRVGSSIANLDTIFLVTSETDNLPYNGTPKPLDVSGTDATGVERGEVPTKYPTVVMATVSTKHTTDGVPSGSGVHRIQSALLEGTVFRDMGDGTVSATILNSYPLTQGNNDNVSEFLSATNSEGWIDDNGYLTKVSEEASNDFIRIYAESLDAEAVSSYPWKG